MADDFSFNIEQSIGLVAPGKGGWNMELNLQAKREQDR